MEMAQEKLRQQHVKELEEKDTELEALKGSTMKKVVSDQWWSRTAFTLTKKCSFAIIHWWHFDSFESND